jgi:hypothetical protein
MMVLLFLWQTIAWLVKDQDEIASKKAGAGSVEPFLLSRIAKYAAEFQTFVHQLLHLFSPHRG